MFLRKIIDFIIPHTCLKCNTINMDYGLCSDCFKNISFITKPNCQSCGEPFINKTRGKYCGLCLKNKPKYILRSVVIYDENSSSLILKFKHGDGTHISPYMANEMTKVIQDFESDIDLIIPVPLHKIRLLKRKYNQSAYLAKIIGKNINKTCDYTSVKRIKNTASQGNKSFSARVKNIKSAFAINDTNIRNKNILIVDDVYTTGATINELSKTLFKSGAKQVYVVCFAKVINKKY